jgi:hopene-associated glycosyltransferase HpnB
MLALLALLLAAASLAVWIYLIAARGGFWAARIREEGLAPPIPAAWPAIAVVVPARNEAEHIARSLSSLLAQDYPGRLAIIVVDDQSTDGTASDAERVATASRGIPQLTVIEGAPLPPGWTGKVWAMSQGMAQAVQLTPAPEYLLFTDADIAYRPAVVRHLVALATSRGYVLTSLMVTLRCQSFAEKALIPAFVFFFQMLYPFAWVNRTGTRTAAAAGGCMLVKAEALRAIGGMSAIRGALIDDCALAKKLKPLGPIWLGLTGRVASLRAYPDVRAVGRMVARSAYDELRSSPALLFGTLGGLALTFFVPPLAAVLATGAPRLVGALGWLLMVVAFVPMLRFYKRSPLWGLGLPLIAAAYLVFTTNSAYQHCRGRGGAWKGRIQANASEAG